MQADIEGAVRAVEVAEAFHWTWKGEEVSRFCDAAGWRIKDQWTHGATLVTDLQIDKPVAFVATDRSFSSSMAAPKSRC